MAKPAVSNSVFKNKSELSDNKRHLHLYMSFSLHSVVFCLFAYFSSVCHFFFFLRYLHAERISAYFCIELSFWTWNLDLLYKFQFRSCACFNIPLFFSFSVFKRIVKALRLFFCAFGYHNKHMRNHFFYVFFFSEWRRQFKISGSILKNKYFHANRLECS